MWKLYACVAVVLAFLLLGTGARGEAMDAVEVGRRVQAVYERVRSYRAKFTQTYRVRAHDKKRVSKGRVAFARPGRLSFRYESGNRVVSDGKTVRVFERDKRQMYELTLQKSLHPAVVAFLSGDTKLARDFDLRLLSAPVARGYALEAVPKEATPAYAKLVLQVDRDSFRVGRVLIVDAQGNTNRFELGSAVLDQPIADREFRFEPPPGTTIIRP